MTKENKFKIGLCLQGIALSMDDITLKANEDRLKMIEDIIAGEQEPCSDAISRQAVLNTEYQVKDINGVDYVMLSEVQMKIRKLPSVTPKEPKTGEWIADVDGYTCSECGVFNADDDNFCPNCGADMRGDA